MHRRGRRGSCGPGCSTRYATRNEPASVAAWATIGARTVAPASGSHPRANRAAVDLPRLDAETLHRVFEAIAATELEHACVLRHPPTVADVEEVVAAAAH